MIGVVIKSWTIALTEMTRYSGIHMIDLTKRSIYLGRRIVELKKKSIIRKFSLLPRKIDMNRDRLDKDLFN
jgi:hypothetical protein